MNYQIMTDKIIESVKKEKPKLLLHSCCAPCSSYVLEYLNEYFTITILFYNPNIYPKSEYIRRRDELFNLLKKLKYSIRIVEIEYNPSDYNFNVIGLETLGEKSKRCYNCYKFRMEQAAQYAKKNEFSFFTTTLSISPYKNSEWINEIGSYLEKKYSINYLYSDFKKRNGYKRSLELSKQYNLYRQNYCGCIYSYENRIIGDKNV